MAQYIYILVFVLTLPGVAFAAPKRVLLITDTEEKAKASVLVGMAARELCEREPSLVLLLQHSTSAKEQKNRSTIEQLYNQYNQARVQYDQLNLDEALNQFTKVAQRLEKLLPTNPELSLYQRSLSMQAASYLLLGQEKKARTVLERLLSLNPKYKPDDSVYNPQMTAIFEGVASRVRGGSTRDVLITTKPAGAVVLVDGRFIGLSPIKARGLPRGPHYVSASNAGFETETKVFEATPKSAKEISLTLNKASGSRADVLSGAAIAAISEPALSSEGKELLTLRRADQILLLSIKSGTISARFFDSNDSPGVAVTLAGEPTDYAAALKVAQQILDVVLHPEKNRNAPIDEPMASEGTPVQTNQANREKDEQGIATTERVSADAQDAPALTQRPGSSSRSTALYLSYGGALVFGALWGTFGVLALNQQKQYYKGNADSASNAPDTTTDQVEGAPIASSGKRYARLADIFMGTALAAAATGLILQILWDDKPATSERTKVVQSESRLEFGPTSVRWQF